jgi:hypothetical protein
MPSLLEKKQLLENNLGFPNQFGKVL